MSLPSTDASSNGSSTENDGLKISERIDGDMAAMSLSAPRCSEDCAPGDMKTGGDGERTPKNGDADTEWTSVNGEPTAERGALPAPASGATMTGV